MWNVFLKDEERGETKEKAEEHVQEKCWSRMAELYK